MAMAMAMDINTAFDLEVRQHCPQARVAYDRSHVVAKYGREVIDRTYGYRDSEFFFMKIKSVFPGNP